MTTVDKAAVWAFRAQLEAADLEQITILQVPGKMVTSGEDVMDWRRWLSGERERLRKSGRWEDVTVRKVGCRLCLVGRYVGPELAKEGPDDVVP